MKLNKWKMVFFIFLLTLPCVIFSQEAWDSTYRPNIYHSRVELFKTLPSSKKDIIFLGNSITFWGEWAEMLGNSHVKNRAIPGDITFGVLELLDDIIKGKPAKIFVLIGINDLARNIPDSIILQNYKRIHQRIRSGSPSTKIFFQTILPTNDSFNKMTSHCNKDVHIQHINGTLKEIAYNGDINLIDLFPHFIDESGKLREEYTFDGVHLTAEGYKQWIKVLKTGKYLI